MPVADTIFICPSAIVLLGSLQMKFVLAQRVLYQHHFIRAGRWCRFLSTPR